MLTMLEPYMSIIKLALYAVAFAAGCALTFHLEQGKIADLNQTIGKYQASNKALSDSVAQQNTAIAQLQSDAKARQDAATKAVASAKHDALGQYTRSQQILGKQLPNGSNACDAASQSLSDELRAERVK